MLHRSGTVEFYRVLGKFCLVFCVVMSLVLVTSARRAALAGFAQAEDAYTQFLAAGGSNADLCRDGNVPHPGSVSCDACRLVDLAVLSPVVALRLPDPFAAIPFAVPPHPSAPHAQVLNPAAPARGPPRII
ncbi:MAG: hypothetical protein ACK4RZ_16075 [Paracoccaceae bacterium]